jgi:hypothetical protein
MEITIKCLIPELTIVLDEKQPTAQDVTNSLLALLSEINNK